MLKYFNVSILFQYGRQFYLIKPKFIVSLLLSFFQGFKDKAMFFSRQITRVNNLDSPGYFFNKQVSTKVLTWLKWNRYFFHLIGFGRVHTYIQRQITLKFVKSLCWKNCQNKKVQAIETWHTWLSVIFQESIHFWIKWDWSRVRKIVKKERRCNKVPLVPLLKVSWFQNVFWVSSFRPKNQQNFFKDFCPSL